VPVEPVPPEGVHAYVYGPVPPATETVAEPLLPPKHETFVEAVIVAVAPAAFVTLTVLVIVQPFASVTVTVYIADVNPVAVAAVPPDGAHEYVYGPVPPEGDTDADPLALPHVACVNDVVAVNAVGCVMLYVRVIVHPFASVTVTV